jgi:predicted kinase
MIVEVVGAPGAGKSFFATQFAQTFGAALLSEDKVRWTLFAHHTYSENEDAMVAQVSDLLLTELLKTGKTFVVDGGYQTKSAREVLAERAKKAGFRILTIVVQVDEPTARRRAMKRNARNLGDRYKQSMTEADYTRLAKAFQTPAVTRDTVVISGKHTYATQARTVLKKMIETRSSVPTPGRAVPIQRSRGRFVQ